MQAFSRKDTDRGASSWYTEIVLKSLVGFDSVLSATAEAKECDAKVGVEYGNWDSSPVIFKVDLRQGKREKAILVAEVN